MSDQDSGDFEGLPPDEATDTDELLDEDDADAPEHWVAADRWGTTPREEAEGEPLSLRLTQEEPEDAPPEPDQPVADTPLEELHLVDQDEVDRG